jgi:hypothetical protein
MQTIVEGCYKGRKTYKLHKLRSTSLQVYNICCYSLVHENCETKLEEGLPNSSERQANSPAATGHQRPATRPLGDQPGQQEDCSSRKPERCWQPFMPSRWGSTASSCHVWQTRRNAVLSRFINERSKQSE